MSISLDYPTYLLYLASHARWWTSNAPGVLYEAEAVALEGR